MAREAHCPTRSSSRGLRPETLREDASASGGDLATLLCPRSRACSQGLGVANCVSSWEPARTGRWAGHHEPCQMQGLFP